MSVNENKDSSLPNEADCVIKDRPPLLVSDMCVCLMCMRFSSSACTQGERADRLSKLLQVEDDLMMPCN